MTPGTLEMLDRRRSRGTDDGTPCRRMNDADLTRGSALEKTARGSNRVSDQASRIDEDKASERDALMMVMTSEMPGSVYMRHE